MSLSPDTRLGHYDISALIGEEGMGQVYQATDTQLNRQVALKILPYAFAGDPDRLARFQREAQVLASLNHPNIAAIHGIEEAEGTRALVLELVEGPTLADRIAKGSIPVDEALPIAKQIAEALEAAHEAGIIHRDLKPANIKVRDDGTVKVLDFGLAKALQEETGGDPSESPTMTAAATAAGVLMGTAAYMSPEQAKGKVVDRRTDVWAFGCVLYEMLTGRRAFPGQSVSETLVTVLTADVDFDALPREVPPTARRLLRRCLQREPKRRLRDIADGLLELDDVLDSRADDSPAAVILSPRVAPLRRALPWVAAVVSVAVAIGLSVWIVRQPPTPLTRDALSVSLPADVSLPSSMRVVAAMSPDGHDLVYVGQSGVTTQLYRRPLDRVEAVPIPDTSGAINPFFSPGGDWVPGGRGLQESAAGRRGGGHRVCSP
jgi:serine/threonine protein kinase